MLLVLGILGVAVWLFVSERLRVDVVALLTLVLVGLADALPGITLLNDPRELFDGFGSNAVIAIIATMIIGTGLNRAGVMARLAGLVLRLGDHRERRLLTLICATAGLVSGFIQNVGAAALFLPVVSHVVVRSHLPMGRLLLPMGYCAILGGTITLVGSSPLILLNDLISNTNKSLPAVHRMVPFELFVVAPVGLALLITGIGYFLLLGRWVLPQGATHNGARPEKTADYFQRIYGVGPDILEIHVPRGNALSGRLIGEIEQQNHIRLIALRMRGNTLLGPTRNVPVDGPAVIAVMGADDHVQAFLERFKLRPRRALVTFNETLAYPQAGVVELVIPPDSDLIGKTAREVWLRKSFGVSLLAIHRGGSIIREEIGTTALQAGDTLLCHSSWRNLSRLERNRNVILVTAEFPHHEPRPDKAGVALGCFAVAILLVLISQLPLAQCLLTGALGMVLTGVISMNEAYEAVSWKTVFLLAGLIPLGQAMETTGTASLLAVLITQGLGDAPPWGLQAALAVLAGGLNLVMSNVGATILLVPLAVNVALASGADPALFALSTAIAACNSFLMPTNQVNALIMGPGDYRVRDFLRAGAPMSVLHLLVNLLVVNSLR